MRAHNYEVICPSGCFARGVSSPFCKKKFWFSEEANHFNNPAVHPTRGAYRDRHGRGVDAVAAEGAQDERA
jgi:hypothetical protein